LTRETVTHCKRVPGGLALCKAGDVDKLLPVVAAAGQQQKQKKCKERRSGCMPRVLWTAVGSVVNTVCAEDAACSSAAAVAVLLLLAAVAVAVAAVAAPTATLLTPPRPQQ
jgi:hypothetical protein